MSVDPDDFYDELVERKVDLFTGVPDSLLKNLCACIADRAPGNRHVVAANEGNAVAVACGYHLATGRYGGVYLQNSGLGNAVNPLLSLADEDVYSIPLLMIVGWRGEPGVHDEPQHVKQGKATLSLLETMGVEYEVLDVRDWRGQVERAVDFLKRESRPFALVVRKDTFACHPFTPENNGLPMTREDALEAIVERIPEDAFVVSSTGKTSRELFEIRERRGEGHEHDFLTVGSMGHTSSIALGMSLGIDADVWCIDGDGSLFMHLGAALTAAGKGERNLKYVINVNGAHESVGGQPTTGLGVDVTNLLRSCGFGLVEEARTKEKLIDGIARLVNSQKPSALVVYTRQGSRADLGRPTVSPQANKELLMKAMPIEV